MFDNDTIQVIYDENRGGKIYDGHTKLWKKSPNKADECTGCENCVKICPTHIDIRKGMQLECINCLECVDACTKTMAGLNLPSLISWTSSNSLKTKQKVRYMRFKTIGYIVVMTVAALALALMSTKKEHMLLNINRTSELYKISHDGNIEVNDTNIKILRPKSSIELKSGEKKKVIVVLGSANIGEYKGGPHTISINAYANDEKERINIVRETIFVYPKE